MTEKLKVLEEILEDLEISDFSKTWIENSNNDEDSVREIYNLLRKYGLKDDKIASQAQLLGRDPETIERNYQHHVGLLRHDYTDRASGRDLLTNQAQLLGISPETTNANVQFLYELGINYRDAFLLGSTPQLKRKKMAWMLRELFDYRNLQQEQKRYVIHRLYDFVKDNPNLLVKSINSLERSRERLREKVENYG